MFGNVQVGNQSTLAFTIANTGTATLTISGVSITTGLSVFAANWTSGTIAAGGSQTVTIQFVPTAAICGTVFDGNGQPAAATMGIAPRPSSTLDVGAIADPYAGGRSLTTFDGTFSFAGIAPGAYTIIARKLRPRVPSA